MMDNRDALSPEWGGTMESEPCRIPWAWVLAVLVFCCLAVALRGVRWDETLERAQAMTGETPYPDGHPLRVYAWGALGFHYPVAALLFQITHSALLLCVSRQVACIALAIFSVWALAVGAGTIRAWAWVAVVVVLAEGHTVFQHYYPISTWPPGKFTSGQLGASCAFLTLAAFMQGRLALGAFLTGLMPLVHVGQAGPICGVALCIIIWRTYTLGWHTMRGPVLAGLAGLACTAGFTLLQMALREPDVTIGPYAAGGDWHAIWAKYTFRDDIHRAYARFGPESHARLGIAIALLFAVGMGLALRHPVKTRHTRKPAQLAVLLYAVFAGMAALGISVAQGALGDKTPFWMMGWMPHRMANHAALIATVLAVAALGRASVGGGTRPRMAACGVTMASLLWIASRPAMACVVPGTYFGRYINPADGSLFLLIGGAAAVTVYCAKPAPARQIWTAMAVTIWLALVWVRPWGGACVLVGALVACLAPLVGVWITRLADVLMHPRVLVAVTAVALASVLFVEWRNREHMLMPPCAQETAAYLAQRGEPDAMLLCPYWTIDYQEATGHPVFATYETTQFLTYMPTLAPVIQRMFADVHNVHFGGDWDIALDAWRTRDPDAWAELGIRYGFRYVLCPDEVARLQLPAVLSHEGWSLYALDTDASR